ncbi:MAG: MFS transporter [Chitinophagaceae bacterium]|nr:MFS transporter [Chitinophagaceae bacterium]MCA6459771.1 MFS transporter [Chitinophagaceae bacterium]MCA6466304.1 MFS transporter [Chitinophagaceae bacterium]
MKNFQTAKREYILHILSAATCTIFFQLYMVAPLIPALSAYFNTSEQTIGLMVPAYLIPYGIATLFYGLLADRIGPKRIILTSLLAFSILTALTAFSKSVNQLIFWRFITGIGASGVVPIALAWIGQTYAFEERGRPLGWLFGAMAGGGAFGSSVGVMLEPFIGWKMLFIGVATAGVFIWIILYRAYLKIKIPTVTKPVLTVSIVFNGYKQLLSSGRGKTAYAYVLLNAIFHAGVFTWLGLYLEKSFGLNGMQIGLALLGYGIPGFLFGPFIGKLADKFGRKKLLPLGLGLSALSAFILIFNIPLGVAAFAITILSLGYDLTQPLLAGIITQVGKERSGQAMSLNVFMLFIGFGLGSYLFGLALKLSLMEAFIIFSIFQAGLSLLAITLFKTEIRTGSLSKEAVSVSH